MDSSYFLISNNTNTSNNDLEQPSFSYDPFDGFSILDQQGMRLYDYFGGGGGRNSPLIYQGSFDQFDLHNHQTTQKNFPFLQTDPNQEDDDDLQGTLTSFVSDFGVDSDAGYTSGVDLFANNTIDCSDSTEAYYLRLALEQNSSSSCSSSSNSSSTSGSNNNISDDCYINNDNFSDINNNNINNSSNNNNDNNICNSYVCNSYNNCNGDSNTSQAVKRSVLMNLLIDGSDVGAGYTSNNCRALPQRITTQQHHQQQQQPNSGNLESQTSYRPLCMDGNWKVTTK